MLDGQVSISGDTTRENVYVLDSDYQNSAQVVLHVYRKTDVITATYDTTTFTLARTIPLPLTGGATVSCFAAANNVAIYAGTSTSPDAAAVNKSTLAPTSIGGFSPPLQVTSIVASNSGYVSVNFGGQFQGFYLFGPDGSAVSDGGGNKIVISRTNAYVP